MKVQLPDGWCEGATEIDDMIADIVTHAAAIETALADLSVVSPIHLDVAAACIYRAIPSLFGVAQEDEPLPQHMP